jgi:transposase-like protein
MSTWTDELREQAVEMYLAQKPNSENSTEVVAQVADELGFSPNSVRMILSKAGVYITKSAGAKPKAETATKGTRVSKEAAQAELVAAIQAKGKDVDEEIVSKLTGKAAVYFAGLLR